MINLVDMSKKYIVGRSNLALTIFVPYDCPNKCPFCTSKDDYRDTKDFGLEKITKALKKVRNCLGPVPDIVITGGEPFADLEQLQTLLDECKRYHKNIYINTTLPVKDKEEADKVFEFILKNQRIINGLNISRHMCLKTNLEDDDLIERIYEHTNTPLRINSVLIGVKAEQTKVKEFIDKYSPFVDAVHFRGDYTKVKTQDDLRGLDHPLLQVLFNLPELTYSSSGGCLVCNDNSFSMYDGTKKSYTRISFHRGFEHSCVKQGPYYILNDIIIKQDGKILCDWDGEELDVRSLELQWGNPR